MSEPDPLVAMRVALRALDAAERERASAWALSGSGLLDAGERRVAQLSVEQEMESARERVRRAREALPTRLEERDWGAH